MLKVTREGTNFTLAVLFSTMFLPAFGENLFSKSGGFICINKSEILDPDFLMKMVMPIPEENCEGLRFKKVDKVIYGQESSYRVRDNFPELSGKIADVRVWQSGTNLESHFSRIIKNNANALGISESLPIYSPELNLYVMLDPSRDPIRFDYFYDSISRPEKYVNCGVNLCSAWIQLTSDLSLSYTFGRRDLRIFIQDSELVKKSVLGLIALN